MWDTTYCSPEIGASILLQTIVKGRMFQELQGSVQTWNGYGRGNVAHLNTELNLVILENFKSRLVTSVEHGRKIYCRK
jgi:hypothetical protein